MLHSMYIFTLGYMMQWYTTNKSVHFRGDHGSLRLRNLCIWWYLALSNFALLKHFILGRRCCLYAFSLKIVSSMDTYTPYELYVQYKCMFKIVEDQRKKQNMRSVNVHRLIIKYNESCHKYLFRNACLTYPLNFHGYPDILIIPHAFLLTCVVVILRCHCLASPGTQPAASQLPLFEWTTA